MEAMTADDDAKRPERPLAPVRSTLSQRRQERDTKQRAEVLSLLMAGLSYDQIAERQGVSNADVRGIIERALASETNTGVATMRAVENARLDRAQAAIWTKVLEGDQKAIQTFLRISQRRSRLNGLDAPMQIELSGSVRFEMEQALNELQEIVLGEVIHDGQYGEEGPAAYS